MEDARNAKLSDHDERSDVQDIATGYAYDRRQVADAYLQKLKETPESEEKCILIYVPCVEVLNPYLDALGDDIKETYPHAARQNGEVVYAAIGDVGMEKTEHGGTFLKLRCKDGGIAPADPSELVPEADLEEMRGWAEVTEAKLSRRTTPHDRALLALLRHERTTVVTFTLNTVYHAQLNGSVCHEVRFHVQSAPCSQNDASPHGHEFRHVLRSRTGRCCVVAATGGALYTTRGHDRRVYSRAGAGRRAISRHRGEYSAERDPLEPFHVALEEGGRCQACADQVHMLGATDAGHTGSCAPPRDM
jgi:hypothetical protein